MFTLKHLSRDGIEAALEKAERYRLLNEPWEAESICADVLVTDPENRRALITMLLSLTDRFERQPGAVATARGLLPRLEREYDRRYYEGIIHERRGKAALTQNLPGGGPMVHDALQQAMTCYEAAERLRPPGNDDAILRWNTCARLIMAHEHVQPGTGERAVPVMLE